MNKNLLLYGANVGKEDADCFYLDFGDAGGSVVISARTLTSFNYSLDKQQWNTVPSGKAINVGSGKVYLRAATPVTSLFSSSSSSNAWLIRGTDVKAGGNINTLLNADDPDGVVYSPNTFDSMFRGCTSLTQAPALPATTLAAACYHNMFYDCTSLTQAPALPATTLTRHCYNSMFYKCTSLTRAPDLPATTLAFSCYYGMFDSCTSLTRAPDLPATTLAEDCYFDMFYDCTSLTRAPDLPATTLADRCYFDMFRGCTSLTRAPELPATTLADSCYFCMFYSCTKLEYIKCLATDISARNCTFSWVDGVAKSGTFVKAPSMTSWKTGTNGIPSGWTVIGI